MVACHMSEIFHKHSPVLLNEAVDNLILSPNGIYVDATFGRGSHSQAILNRLSAKGRLFAFDKDPDAVAYAQKHFAHDSRFTIFHNSFSRMQNVLNEIDIANVNGILFDLGVSSPQLENPDRGFSFMHNGKLDMRMDTTRGEDAKYWLATITEADLADILWQYGEEKFARRIARGIVTAREQSTITTTGQLVEIILNAVPKQKHWQKHPATRTFQAIRIAVNQELNELQQGLEQAFTLLAKGGRLGVISFHSLEDRIVKQFIRQHEKGKELPKGLPVKGKRYQARLKTIGKPIKPGLHEVNINPRARSAILRIAEKLS